MQDLSRLTQILYSLGQDVCEQIGPMLGINRASDHYALDTRRIVCIVSRASGIGPICVTLF